MKNLLLKLVHIFLCRHSVISGLIVAVFNEDVIDFANFKKIEVSNFDADLVTSQ